MQIISKPQEYEPKKMYRLKEDQALFRFRWNWDEKKKLLGIRLQISSPFLPRRAPPNLSPHLFRRGW